MAYIRESVKQLAATEEQDTCDELEQKLSCEHCGFLVVTEEETHYLEDAWSTGETGKPTYVDRCDCDETGKELSGKYEDLRDEFFAFGKRKTLRDGFYDVTGIERLFVGSTFCSDDNGVLAQAVELMSAPETVCAKPYQVDELIILAKEPPAVEVEEEGYFSAGANIIIKGKLPAELLILNEND
jgi:hypothetical protein